MICHKGLNSSYIRTGSRGALKKIGSYCDNCAIHYDLEQKLYTVNEKLYTVSNPIPKMQISEADQDIISNNSVYSNNPDKSSKTMQNLYGPGRIRTNDPRHVKTH